MNDCSPLDTLSDILMDVPDLVFAYGREGHYLFVNRTAAAFLGVDPLEIIGQHWRDLGYPAEVMEPLTASVAEVANTMAPAVVRFTGTPERGSRTFDMSLTPLRCGTGQLMAVLAIAHDISEFS